MKKKIALGLTILLISIMIIGFVSARYIIPSKDVSVQEIVKIEKPIIQSTDENLEISQQEKDKKNNKEIEQPNHIPNNIYNWVYQETADNYRDTECEGIYIWDQFDYSSDNIYDSDWNTYGKVYSSSEHAELFINYIKSPLAKIAIWQVKDSSGTTNLSIPSSCWNPDYFGGYLKLKVSSWNEVSWGINRTVWECILPGGSTVVLRNVTGEYAYIYEEGIYWGIDKDSKGLLQFISPTDEDNSIKIKNFIHLDLEPFFEKTSKWIYYLYKEGDLYQSYDSSIVGSGFPKIADNNLISAGSDFTCFLKQDGSVQCQGSANINGQVDPYLGNDVVQVATGAAHTCFLKQDGSVQCQGANYYGQSNNYLGHDVVQVSAGLTHTCFLKQDGSVQCQGRNMNHCADDYLGHDVVQVATGRYHTCFLKQDGSVKCSGYDQFGSLGQDRDYTGHDVVQVSAGGDHTCFLKQDGSVQCQGAYYNDRTKNYLGNDAIQVATGLLNTCFLKQDGSVQCQGENSYGQANNYTGHDVIQVTLGNSHTCFLKQDGSVQCQGSNYYGQADDHLGNDIKTTPYYYFLGLAQGDYYLNSTVCNENSVCTSTETRKITITNGGNLVRDSMIPLNKDKKTYLIADNVYDNEMIFLN